MHLTLQVLNSGFLSVRLHAHLTQPFAVLKTTFKRGVPEIVEGRPSGIEGPVKASRSFARSGKAVFLEHQPIPSASKGGLGTPFLGKHRTECFILGLGGVIHYLAVPSLGLGLNAKQRLGTHVLNSTDLGQSPLLDNNSIVSRGLLEEGHATHELRGLTLCVSNGRKR
jgi:hypothetical protein